VTRRQGPRNMNACRVALLCASVLTLGWGFTPKGTQHCIKWSTEIPEPRVPIYSEHGHEGRQLCRPSHHKHRSNALGDTVWWDKVSARSFGSNFGIDGKKRKMMGRHLHMGEIHHHGGEDTCIPLAFVPAHHERHVMRQWKPAESVAPGFQPQYYSRLQRQGLQYMHVDPSCDVYWREVTADVIPPIPELLFIFGKSRTGEKLGVCRTFDRDPELEDNGRRMGTFVAEGTDFGKCFFTNEEGEIEALDGGKFYVIQVRASEEKCEKNLMKTLDLVSQLTSRIDKFITEEDQGNIEEVTGVPFSTLNQELMELGNCDLARILSPARFVPLSLNYMGLHILRALLAERMHEARAQARGYNTHPDYVVYRRDGILIKDFAKMGEHGFKKLLQMASGEETLGIPQPPFRLQWRNVTVEEKVDSQTDLHVDTVSAVTKVWFFLNPPGVSHAEGPLNYVRGSHRNTIGKLRWMHAYSLSPATAAMREPSFRLEGDPNATRAASEYVSWANENKFEVFPIPNARRTVVIADTSGLHARGLGIPGRTRVSQRLWGDNDGGLARLDPFRMPKESAFEEDHEEL